MRLRFQSLNFVTLTLLLSIVSPLIPLCRVDATVDPSQSLLQTEKSEQRLLEGDAGVENQAIQLGRELARLQSIPPSERTPDQKQRLDELQKFQKGLRRQFDEFINSPDVVALVQQVGQLSRQQTFDLRNLNSLKDKLQQLDRGTVMLYPLTMDDRIELVLVTPYAPPIRRTVAVKREELHQAIAQFRSALQNPASDAIVPAQTLYNWLIKPIESDLAQADAKTILFAPDGQLRYIPLAALHDGDRWLVQRFRMNNITAATLTDFRPQRQTQPRVLAAAMSEGNYNIKIGDREFTFSGLPHAAREVESIAATLPNTTVLLGRDFSPAIVIPRLNNYSIIHLATNAAFLAGQPEDSFILFGDGSRITLRDVGNWNLNKVDLVVLSACETGVGGQLGNGEEILGFGYQMQRAGAKAVIASLWLIGDESTQVLMDAFYKAIARGTIAKAEALRQAQIELITGSNIAPSPHKGITVEQHRENSDRFSHPYYWAPFILIGNGL